MKRLRQDEIQELADEFYSESEDDLVGLWEIVKEVEKRLGEGDSAREQTLEIVQALLTRGLLVGDPPYSAGGYCPWPSQQPDVVLERIRSEWLELGRTPNIPDIAWFDRAR